MVNRILIALLAVAGSWIGYTQIPKKIEAPMPAPTPANSANLTAKRLEIVDDAGKVMIVLTFEGGIPVAIVSDKGEARKIDLAKVARLVK